LEGSRSVTALTVLTVQTVLTVLTVGHAIQRQLRAQDS
jgi:hypothetical protein